MDPVYPQDPSFLFDRALKASVDDERRYGSQDLGPTENLPEGLRELEYQAFFGFGLSPLSSPSTSPSPSRSTSPSPINSKLSSRTPLATPPAADASIPTSVTQNSKSRKNKKNGCENRNRKRQAAQDALQDTSYSVSNRILSKYVETATPTRTSFDAVRFPTASTGYISLPDEGGKVFTLSELVDKKGFKVERWDGRNPRPIVDASSRIIGVLVGQPDDPTWEAVHHGALETILASRSKCKFPRKSTNHRRGKFPALSWGISHGGGQTRPGNLYHNAQNSQVLSNLTANKNISRIAGYANGAFATWAPKLYTYYEKNIELLLRHDRDLRRNWLNSVWASFAVNFGPQTICRRHRDFANIPFGWCGITALGDFDPTRGGHLVLWSLKIVAEFPPGSTILIPSAAIAHSNVPISKGETRCSFTQYTAGGLVRWVEQGFQCTDEYKASLTSEQMVEDSKKQEERCRLGTSLFSTISSINADRSIRKTVV